MEIQSIIHTKTENNITPNLGSIKKYVYEKRQLLNKYLCENDLQKSKELYDTLNKINLNDYTTFTIAEHFYINIILNDWNNLLNLFKDYKRDYRGWNISNELIISSKGINIANKSIENKDIYLKPLKLNQEDEQIIEIYLIYFKKPELNKELDEKISAFKKNYKSSKYDNFINDYFPKKVKGVSFSMSMGSGTVFPMGKIAKDFNTNMGINVSFDFNFWKIHTSYMLNNVNFNTKKSLSLFENNDTIELSKGYKFNFANSGLKVGYFLIRNKRFHIAPYAGISKISFKNIEDDNNSDKKIEIIKSYGYEIGIHTEMKLYDFKKSYYYLSLKLESGYTYITKFNYGYNGNLPYINTALVFGLNDF